MASFDYSLHKFIPFKDSEACARVRAIKREEITKTQRWAHKQFKIRLIEDPAQFSYEFALDIVNRIKQAYEEGRQFVGVFPVGPMPQYTYAAKLINQLQLPLKHVHTFNMDEYADYAGNTAPADWAGSFQKAMFDSFFNLIDSKLRPPARQIHFPTKRYLKDYAKMIEEAGGADVCYGGIGWCGHIAFWEAHLGDEFGDDLKAYVNAGPRHLELHPMTIMQNALHSFSGDWSWVPPCANTIGPEQVMKARWRSFWLDGAFPGGVSWQRFIARLVAHGPVNTYVPGSILQTAPGDMVILGSVADNCEIHMA